LGRHNPVGKSKNVVGERGRKGSNYTTTTTSEKIKINFVLLFLVVSFSLCDLIVMEHTALPWKMPFQLSLADETTNSRHNESRFFGRALFNNHRKNKKKMEK
jgi:hypothetical protein